MKVEFHNMVVGRDWGWICENLPLSLSEDLRGIIAVDVDKQERIAAVILYGWTENSVMAHVIIKNPMVLRHGLIKEFKRYVFDVCKRSIVIGTVPSDNHKALRFDTHLGFKEIHRIKDGYEIGNDIVIMEMRSDGQQQESARSASSA